MVRIHIESRRRKRTFPHVPFGPRTQSTFDVESAEDLDEILEVKRDDAIDSVEVEGVGANVDSRKKYDMYLEGFYGDFVASNFMRTGDFGELYYDEEGPQFSAVEVLKTLDPNLYELGFKQWKEEGIESAREELEQYEEKRHYGLIDYLMGFIG